MNKTRFRWIAAAALACAAVLIAIAVPGCRTDQPRTNGTPAETHGAVSSAHPLATEAGIAILRKGGNAFDAAVAVAAALNVVEPAMSGMGGYGTILVYDARKDEIRFLNSSGRIPAGLDPDVFRPPHPRFKENRSGPAAVSTPGNVHAWEAMSKEYGALRWSELFEAAVDLAENGFTLDKGGAATIRAAFDDFPAHVRAFYGRGGQPLGDGDRLVQKDLARSLRLVASQGARAFYSGPIAEAIDSAMSASGGFLSRADLENDEAEWREPIRISYRDCEVVTASPPATAFPSLIRLGLMSRFDAAALGHNSAAFLHRFIETTKHAFWCRLRYAGDPEVAPPPLATLLSPAYWDEQAAAIDLERAKPFVYPGLGEGDKDGGPDPHDPLRRRRRRRGTSSRPPRPSATPSAAGSCPRARASGSTTPWPTAPSSPRATPWTPTPGGASFRATARRSSFAGEGRGRPSERREATRSARPSPRWS
jgi:gamma-glutamyltranspeptidase / glutathione hydrolase